MLLIIEATNSMTVEENSGNHVARTSTEAVSHRARKARLVKKLKKDFRKLKKQDGAVKLVGGTRNDYGGTIS